MRRVCSKPLENMFQSLGTQNKPPTLPWPQRTAPSAWFHTWACNVVVLFLSFRCFFHAQLGGGMFKLFKFFWQSYSLVYPWTIPVIYCSLIFTVASTNSLYTESILSNNLGCDQKKVWTRFGKELVELFGHAEDAWHAGMQQAAASANLSGNLPRPHLQSAS